MNNEFNDKQKWLDTVNNRNLKLKYWKCGSMAAYDDDGVCVGCWYDGKGQCGWIRKHF